MKPAQPKAPPAPKDRPHVEHGDQVYFQHKGEPYRGKVLSHGEHGCTVELNTGARHKVRWENLLGHHTRGQIAFEIVEQGEDGFIVADPGGRYRYVHDPLEGEDGDAGDSLTKALALSESPLERIMAIRDHERQESPLMKALRGGGKPKKNAPGLTLQDVTDKLGHRTKRWKKTGQEAPKPHQAKPEAPKATHPPEHADASNGQTVKFKAGDFEGEGKILAHGAKGAQVQDKSGRIHKVDWSEIHEREGKASKPEAAAAGKPDLKAMVGEAKAQRERHAELAEKHGADDKPVKVAHKDGRAGLVSPDLQRKGGWRFTRMDGDGPVGHSEHGSKKDALREAMSSGYEPGDAAAEGNKDFFSESETKGLPRKAEQPYHTWEELESHAEEAQSQFSGVLHQIAGKMGLRTDLAPEDLKDDALESKDGFLFLGPIKKKERAQRKVDGEYDGDWGKVTDLIRATISVSSFDEVHQAVAAVKAAGLHLAQRPKDKFAEPTHAGYRDLMTIVKLPNGMLAELQYHLKPITAAKAVHHHDYAEMGKLQAKYGEEAPTGAWSDEDHAAFHASVKRQREGYDAAWKKAGGTD